MSRQPVKTIDQIEAPEEQTKDLRKAEKGLVPVMEDEGLYHIEYQPAGGEVPDELKGKYTQKRLAQAAIENYMAEHEKQAA
jgi:F0F1-type ATP synthase gamma subunit